MYILTRSSRQSWRCPSSAFRRRADTAEKNPVRRPPWRRQLQRPRGRLTAEIPALPAACSIGQPPLDRAVESDRRHDTQREQAAQLNFENRDREALAIVRRGEALHSVALIPAADDFETLQHRGIGADRDAEFSGRRSLDEGRGRRLFAFGLTLVWIVQHVPPQDRSMGSLAEQVVHHEPAALVHTDQRAPVQDVPQRPVVVVHLAFEDERGRSEERRVGKEGRGWWAWGN